MKTVFHVRPYGRFTEIRKPQEKKNFIINARVFLEAVLAIGIK